MDLVTPNITDDFVHITSGYRYSCGITTIGEAWCWGLGHEGNLGNSASADSPIPVKVSGGHSWQTIEAGSAPYLWDDSRETTCGITLSGDLYCWGYNVHGQLGQGNTGASINEPKLISNGRKWRQVTIADLHVCAIDIAGDGFCWGWQNNGQLGDNTGTTDRYAPVAIKSPYKWRNLSAGVRSSCGITTENELYCWGAGGRYRLGTGSTASSNIPLKVSTSEKFKYVEGARDYYCALSINNDLYCWGRNDYGQIGDNKVGVDRQTPYLVMSDVHSFGAGIAQMCALKNSGKAYCTGNAEHGRLGNAKCKCYF